MGQPDVSAAPEGITVDAVDWLPSGAASGLVRVRGRTTGAVEGLPDLVIDHAGREHRFTSLPDPRGDLEPQAWRGAYVVGAALVAAAGAQMGLEWPGGARLALPAVAADVPPGLPAPVEEEPGGEVVDRAVLAERRARRAEAAEQAQARIAREALRAVEVLELRANELEARLEAGTPAADEETRGRPRPPGRGAGARAGADRPGRRARARAGGAPGPGARLRRRTARPSASATPSPRRSSPSASCGSSSTRPSSPAGRATSPPARTPCAARSSSTSAPGWRRRWRTRAGRSPTPRARRDGCRSWRPSATSCAGSSRLATPSCRLHASAWRRSRPTWRAPGRRPSVRRVS